MSPKVNLLASFATSTIYIMYRMVAAKQDTRQSTSVFYATGIPLRLTSRMVAMKQDTRPSAFSKIGLSKRRSGRMGNRRKARGTRTGRRERASRITLYKCRAKLAE
jgi:hypothetical protein